MLARYSNVWGEVSDFLYAMLWNEAYQWTHVELNENTFYNISKNPSSLIIIFVFIQIFICQNKFWLIRTIWFGGTDWLSVFPPTWCQRFLLIINIFLCAQDMASSGRSVITCDILILCLIVEIMFIVIHKTLLKHGLHVTLPPFF